MNNNLQYSIEILPKGMTRTQLAASAGVCLATFNKWIRKELPVVKKIRLPAPRATAKNTASS